MNSNEVFIYRGSRYVFIKADGPDIIARSAEQAHQIFRFDVRQQQFFLTIPAFHAERIVLRIRDGVSYEKALAEEIVRSHLSAAEWVEVIKLVEAQR